MAKLQTWPTYTLLGAFGLALLVFGVYGFLHNRQDLVVNPTASEVTKVAGAETPVTVATSSVVGTTSIAWTTVYPDTKSMKIGDAVFQASIAKTWPERISGLSGTPFLPENVVKLFIFDSPGLHSIWMKDMLYAIDIIWVDETRSIIQIKESATPESFPESFVPTREALYVIETAAGVSGRLGIEVGDSIVLPEMY